MEEEYGKNQKLNGRYANYFKIGHNEYEFVMDFGQLYQQNGSEKFHTRIITSPVYAQAFLNSLLESIYIYEHEFGPIEKEIQAYNKVSE